jgi:hypothetical protein
LVKAQRESQALEKNESGDKRKNWRGRRQDVDQPILQVSIHTHEHAHTHTHTHTHTHSSIEGVIYIASKIRLKYFCDLSKAPPSRRDGLD